jgi:hypothetical protein
MRRREEVSVAQRAQGGGRGDAEHRRGQQGQLAHRQPTAIDVVARVPGIKARLNTSILSDRRQSPPSKLPDGRTGLHPGGLTSAVGTTVGF